MRTRLRYWEPVRLATRIRQLGWQGLPEFPGRATRRLRNYLLSPWKRCTVGRQTFELDGVTYRYTAHSYTATWDNERAVEIPLALAFMDRHRAGNLLEVGNVIRHFDRAADHTVVDKYDRRPGVLSIDIDGFVPAVPFDALLSISTYEHVGWDESPRDPGKVERALRAIPHLVTEPAAVLVTLPIGYHPRVDELIASGQMPFASESFLVRQDGGRWVQATRDEALRCQYDTPFPAGNGLYVGRGIAPGPAGEP